MIINLTRNEMLTIEGILEQEIEFQQGEPEHDEEIKAQIKPYQQIVRKLYRARTSKKEF